MRLLFFLLLFSSLFNSQVIKDSILGKPKFVKEYVVFLNNSGSFTFMQGDSEYGHATRMNPDNLRESMLKSWFETDFCRYTNNETHYNKNKKITEETWFYKDGSLVDNYKYKYDRINRLISKTRRGKTSETSQTFFYEGKEKAPSFREYNYKNKAENIKKFDKINHQKPFSISKFDTVSKADSIFWVTDFIWKKVGEKSYQEANDSIYRKKLVQVKFYDDNLRMIETKFFDYKSDHFNKKIFQISHKKYSYDSEGNVTKETELQDGKYHYYIISEGGKYIKEEKEGNYSKSSSIEYSYMLDGTLQQKTDLYNGNISNQIRFEYKNNLIEKLFYLDTWGKKEKDLKPNIIIFKYKFDRHKNWIECIKNVDGEDLYMWKREIEYYK